MAADRAAILASLVDCLDELDHHIGALLKANRERIAHADELVQASFMQMAGDRER